LPTILIEDGFRLYFFANESNEPPHVHVQYQQAVAKFWLNPVALGKNKGMKPADLKKAGELVRKHEKLAKEKWNEFFGKET
jgi:hypothetical protein